MPTATPATRKERRDQARRERLEREQALMASAARRRRLMSLGAIAGIAALIVAVLIVVSSGGGGGSSTTSAGTNRPLAGVQQSRALFAGVPQHGTTLGSAKAPVRVVEFADLQCPFCRAYSLDVMPGLVQKYVKTGQVSMEFRNLAFIGPDSVREARLAAAAGRQNRLWNLVDLLYHNQGNENSGFATDAFLHRVASSVPGLDVGRAFAERDSAAVTSQLEAANSAATSAGVNSTPTFLVEGGTSVKTVDAAGLPAAIQAALGR